MVWFEDDVFWEMLYPFLFNERRFQETREQTEKLLALVPIKGKCVLDLCCGPGRFSRVLAEKGFQVTGVDRTRMYLEKAKALSKDLSIEWIEADMREFLRPVSFDLVLCMFTSFGYFEDRNEDRLVLQNMFTNLRLGGYCVIEVMGKEILAKIFEPTTSEKASDGTVMVVRHQIMKEWTWMKNDWIFMRDGKCKTFEIEHNVYSGLELKTLMEESGFTDIKLFGDFEGNEYGIDAQRLIAVGRRGEDFLD